MIMTSKRSPPPEVLQVKLPPFPFQPGKSLIRDPEQERLPLITQSCLRLRDSSTSPFSYRIRLPDTPILEKDLPSSFSFGSLFPEMGDRPAYLEDRVLKSFQSLLSACRVATPATGHPARSDTIKLIVRHPLLRPPLRNHIGVGVFPVYDAKVFVTPEEFTFLSSHHSTVSAFSSEQKVRARKSSF